MKECVKCKINKEDSSFYLKKERNGLKRLCSWCKSCSTEAATLSNKRKKSINPEKVKQLDREYYKNNKDKRCVSSSIRRKELKRKCVEYLGGKCISCGYNKYLSALDFHHKNKEEKEFMITQTTNWVKIEKELEKCILLFSNCHRGIHSGELIIQLDAV